MPLKGLIVDTDAWLVASLLAAAMTFAWAIGWRRGLREKARGLEAPESKLEDASLALLGLLLAFTFSISLEKFDRRRDALVADSNAIGDFYTCVTLGPEPPRTGLQQVIRDYTRLRLDVASSGWDSKVESALPRFEQMQGRMTELVGQAISAGTPIAITLTETLNGLTSSHAARLVAIRDRLPDSIVALLLIAATFTAGLVGRQQGFSRHPSLAGTVCFIVVVTLTVAVTLDLNQPAHGMIRLSQEPMERLLSSMRK